MTTSQSSVFKLKQQSDAMARNLKAIEKGTLTAADPHGKLAAARAKEGLKFGVVMDDRLITIEMSWVAIRDYSERALSEFILKQMRGAKEDS